MKTMIDLTQAVTDVLGSNAQAIIQKVVENLQTAFDEDTLIDIRVCDKTNRKLCGISIRPRQEQVAPTLYLEDLLGLMDSTEGEIDEIAEELTRIILDKFLYVLKSLPEDKQDVLRFQEILQDYEQAKNYLQCRVVNAERQSNLENVPHFMLVENELVVIYSLSCQKFSYIVKDFDLERWDISEQQLKEDAMQNMRATKTPTRDFLFCKVISLQEENDIDPSEMRRIQEELNQSSDPMALAQVLSFQDLNFGAAVLLYEDFLQKLVNQCGSGFILPSSIHDVIFVPVKEFDEDQKEHFEWVVQNANRTAVSEEEFLSDRVFWLDENGIKILD